MRSAAEILFDINKQYVIEQGDEELAREITFAEFLKNAGTSSEAREFFIVSTRAINKARKETIEECAERARFTRVKVNKESILSLINELK